MGRVSRAQAERNRERVVAVASRLFREQGVENVSVADLMNAAGLTHGGFYKQFASKEALQAEALAYGLISREQDFAAFEAGHADRAAAREALLDAYLSTAHRDDPGDGCPTAGFAVDVARLGPGPLRDHYAAGVRRYARWLSDADAGAEPDGSDAGAEPDGSDAGAGAAGGAVAGAGAGGSDAGGTPAGGGADAGGAVDPAALAGLCTMVGALLLARATAGDPVSGEILVAAREACRAPRAGRAPQERPPARDPRGPAA